MSKNFKTKIIAGKFKGKFIDIPNTPITRSSKNILKESLFNTIQFDIIGKNFVEVFAGSGSIGLEALSRGANRCYFIEQSRDVFSILEKNIDKLDSSRCTAIYGDSFIKFNELLKILNRDNTKTYFYFDPPFSIRDGMDSVYYRVIKLIEGINPDITEMVIIEHMTKEQMPDSIREFKKVKSKKFGKSSLSYYEVS